MQQIIRVRFAVLLSSCFVFSIALWGCNFNSGGLEIATDAPTDSIDASNTDASGVDSMTGPCLDLPTPLPFISGCLPLATANLDISAQTSFDTDSGVFSPTMSASTAILPATNPSQDLDIRVIVVPNLTIQTGAMLRATGDLPLLIVATEEVVIEGALEASANFSEAGPGYNPAYCGKSDPSNSTVDGGGADGSGTDQPSGGGGGGGFLTVGGNGADNLAGAGLSLGGEAVASADITSLRGGCPGGNGGTHSSGTGGTGGGAGGAIYIHAQDSISISSVGYISTVGGGGLGGQNSGGGGGGSGGLIVLTAGKNIVSIGGISATGAGGGSGSGTGVGGVPGENGQLFNNIAQGGGSSGQPSSGGMGALSESVLAQDGQTGTAGSEGGGGAGGGAGFILYKAAGVASFDGKAFPTPLLLP